MPLLGPSICCQDDCCLFTDYQPLHEVIFDLWSHLLRIFHAFSEAFPTLRKRLLFLLLLFLFEVLHHVDRFSLISVPVSCKVSLSYLFFSFPFDSVHRHTLSRSLFQRPCSQTHMWRTPHTSVYFFKKGFKVGLKSHSIRSSDAHLPCLSATVATSTTTLLHRTSVVPLHLGTNSRFVFGTATLHRPSTGCESNANDSTNANVWIKNDEQ